MQRYAGNPILTVKDVPKKCLSVSNSAVTRYKGEYIMLADAAISVSYSEFFVAHSKNGYDFKLEKKPIFVSKKPLRFYDPRMTRIGNTYYILFGVDHPEGEVTVGMAKTTDFKKVEYCGEISPPDVRNAVLFPEKIGGLYVRLDRPFPLYYHWGWPAGTHPNVKKGKTWPDTLNIWISFSPDLVYWGRAQVLLDVKRVPWANHKLGPGAPPIKTRHGWLEIFHGAELTRDNKKIYRLGCMLLDLKNPTRILGLAKKPILEPVEPYECHGLVPSVVFACGVVPEKNGELKIYYGGADKCVCMATATIDELVNLCR